MATWTRTIRQLLQLLLLALLFDPRRANLMILLQRPRNLSLFPEHLHLHQPRLYALIQISDCLQQSIGLGDLVGGFVQPSLGGIDATIALVDVTGEVARVVGLVAWVAAFRLVLFVGRFVGFEMHLFARAQVLLGIGEQVVRARADQEGAANVCVGVVAGGGGCVGRAH